MSAPRRIRRPFPAIAIGFGLIIGVLAVGSAPAAAQGSPEDVLSHFLCYRGTFPTFTPVPSVFFRDQFGPLTAAVAKPHLFCDPVRKTRRSGEVTKIVDIAQHLKGYVLRTASTTDTRSLLVSNQFGKDQPVTVAALPTQLLVPTRKAPHDPPKGLDHLTCYTVQKGRAIDRDVELKDQFTSFRTHVGKPKLHCNPTLKQIAIGVPPTPIENPDAHLLCYGIDRHPLDPPQARKTSNQFEKARVKAEVAVLLCVPSTKVEVP